jgi:hypothetical protein
LLDQTQVIKIKYTPQKLTRCAVVNIRDKVTHYKAMDNALQRLLHEGCGVIITTIADGIGEVIDEMGPIRLHHPFR